MRKRHASVVAVAVLLAGAANAAVAAPAPASGPTYTKITTPSSNLIFRYNGKVAPDANTFTVAGQASTDIDTVDIDCIFSPDTGPEIATLASSVPVSGSGTFSTIASFENSGIGLTIPCRLRAVPSTMVNPASSYLGSFAGPILRTNGAFLYKHGSTVYDFVGTGEQGDAVGEITSAGFCGTAGVATIQVPEMRVDGTGTLACAFALPGNNVTKGGNPTGSAVQVDGHNAYLPAAVNTYLDSEQSLGLTPQALSVSVFRPDKTGDITITESAPLMRCSPADTYPPTTGSCSSLATTGVTFTRVSEIFRGAHQVKVRDTYSANGGAHTVSLQYDGELENPGTGAPGYVFPGGSSHFHGEGLGATVTGLGTKAGTVLMRTDRFAASDDVDASTLGLTWSRAPKKVQFDGTLPDYYAMPYSLSIPAHRARYLGFAYSGELRTIDTKHLAALALADMMNAPAIGSPASGSHITGHKTTVKGSVRLGANGLPTKVAVNGHTASLNVNSKQTEATYSATFSEPFGKHTIKVVASDSAGNTRSASIKVKNVA
jgi:hypothetical protein